MTWKNIQVSQCTPHLPEGRKRASDLPVCRSCLWRGYQQHQTADPSDPASCNDLNHSIVNSTNKYTNTHSAKNASPPPPRIHTLSSSKYSISPYYYPTWDLQNVNRKESNRCLPFFFKPGAFLSATVIIITIIIIIVRSY